MTMSHIPGYVDKVSRAKFNLHGVAKCIFEPLCELTLEKYCRIVEIRQCYQFPQTLALIAM